VIAESLLLPYGPPDFAHRLPPALFSPEAGEIQKRQKEEEEDRHKIYTYERGYGKRWYSERRA